MTIHYDYDATGRVTKAEYDGAGSINYRYDGAGNITEVTILINGSSVIDSDHDGIDDAWELLHRGNLVALAAHTDYDRDGYSDLWEYLNWRDALTDSNGTSFNPVLTNTPGERGYSLTNSFWNLVMPAILSGKNRR